VDSHQGGCKRCEDHVKIPDSERALALCGGLKGSRLVWRAQGRIRLDPVRDRVGLVCHGISKGD
jgi:hypothetical protein